MKKKATVELQAEGKWWESDTYEAKFKVRRLSGPTMRRTMLDATAAYERTQGAGILEGTFGKYSCAKHVNSEIRRTAVTDWEKIGAKGTGKSAPFDGDLLVELDEDLLEELDNHIASLTDFTVPAKKNSGVTLKGTTLVSLLDPGSSGLQTAAKRRGGSSTNRTRAKSRRKTGTRA